MSKIKLATVFSGIGAIEWALKRMNIAYEIVFACDNGEIEIDYDVFKEREKISKLNSFQEKQKYVHDLYKSKTRRTNFVKKTYLANYDLDESRFFEDIILLDGKDFKNEVDLFVGGSPCQSFSSVGCQEGLDDPRGNLFYEYTRLVKEIQPKVFIYENVRNLINHDNGRTWETIRNEFESLGYHLSTPEILNSADYGIPQTRRRLFVIGCKKNMDIIWPPLKKELQYAMRDFLIDNCDFCNFNSNKNGEIIINHVPGNVGDKYILTPKLYDYVMKSGTKTFYQKPIINKEIARTILKTMGNRHRAGVDNYVSRDGVSTNLGDVRMLSEREALRLMGFTDDFKIVVSRSQCYKQAGNSIVVDVLMAIIQSILDGKLL